VYGGSQTGGHGGSGGSLGPADAIYQPDLNWITGNPYEQAVQAGYSAQAANAIAKIQDAYARNAESLKAQLAAQGILDSGVGAQAMADLMSRTQSEINSAINDLFVKQSEYMSQQHQQAIDNAFSYSNLDLAIANYHLDRQKLQEMMDKDDNTFAAQAQDMAFRYGVNPAVLYDARKYYKSQLSQKGVA
jgi:hypothetical protein